MQHIQALSELYESYDIVFCDVWGVVHDGIRPFADSVAALQAARKAGKIVILVTNSPRPAPSVIQQLDQIGVARDAYDNIVTSGDVTRTLIQQASRRIFHIGADRDLTLYDGLDVELVEDVEAGAIVCTGLFDDETETPEDYAPLLARLRGRNLPFICANPDIVVERGDKMIWCAGALARDYGLLGGRTLVAGKPHSPIYKQALAMAQQLKNAEIKTDRVLAIGDGMLTDVKGAQQAGFDVLYIAGGIHAGDYTFDGVIEAAKLQQFITQYGPDPVAYMERLA